MSELVPFAHQQVLAEAFAKSKLFGMTDPNQVLALMAICEAEGIHPARAVQEFHLINGKPALRADAMLARFQKAGGKVEWSEYSDTKVTGVFSHPNGGSLEVTWTIEQAHSIGLVRSGSGWTKFPRAMLRSRCVSEGVRSVYPGCVTGVYTPDEVESMDDAKPRATRVTKDMGPAVVVQGPSPDAPPEESVALGPLEDMVDAVPIDAYNLHLPDGSIYAGFPTADEWVGGFTNMVYRVKASPKLADDAKKEKIMALRKANKHILDKLSATQKVAAMAGSKGIAVDEETGEIVA